jgi:mannose-1-phosphate guanylyltransferase/mannose-6-phosphate isomerase
MTMLQETIHRLQGMADIAETCIVVCNEAHRFLVAEQLREIEQSAKTILEPEGRNTAPAIALAALLSLESDDDDLILVLPADHVIKDIPAFHAAVARGAAATREGKLVTFGIVPTRPETGYGYIEADPRGSDAVPVSSFVEKPDAATAQKYVDSGSYFWNSGMFLFSARSFMDALANCAPGIHDQVSKSMSDRTVDADFVRPDAAAFAKSPSGSVDIEVMERADTVTMVPLDAGWSDVGSWSALHDEREHDDAGNTVDGDVILRDCKGSFVQAESQLVAAIGLEDMLVIQTKNAVLVARKSMSQDVKDIVDELKVQERGEVELHRQVFRPWGSFDSLEKAENFQVKRLIIRPGAEISLQQHARRSEHWVVVHGKVQITRNDEEFVLAENESTYVAIGDVHRIANPFGEDAHIIEVQCGDYLGEDDIVRLDDQYGRQGTNT